MAEEKKKKKSKHRINLDEEAVLRNSEVYTGYGRHVFRHNKYSHAMRYLDLAMELKPEAILPLEPRSAALIKLGLASDALLELEQLETALKAEDGDAELPMSGRLLRIQALWEGAEFEQAALLAARAKRVRVKPPYFKDMFDTSLVTVEQCIGESAGEVLADLSKEIHAIAKMRRKEALQLAQGKCTPHREPVKSVEQTRRQLRMEAFRHHQWVYKAQLLMGGLGKECDFVHKLPHRRAFPTGNTWGPTRIRKHLAVLGEHLDRRLAILEAACPMYVIRRRCFPRQSEQRSARVASFERNQAQEIQEDARHCMERILEARMRGEAKHTLDCCNLARQFIMATPRRMLPEKSTYLTVVYHMYGILHLEMKLPPQDATEEEQEFHIQAVLGTQKNSVDVSIKDSSMPFTNYRARQSHAEKRLKLTGFRAERVWLLHELGLAYSRSGRHESSRSAARRALAEARQLNSHVWAINVCILQARAEVHLKMPLDARTSLKEALEWGEALGDQHVLAVIQGMMQEVEKENQDTDEEAEEVGEILLRLMVTPELRRKAMCLVRHISLQPPEARLSMRDQGPKRQQTLVNSRRTSSIFGSTGKGV